MLDEFMNDASGSRGSESEALEPVGGRFINGAAGTKEDGGHWLHIAPSRGSKFLLKLFVLLLFVAGGIVVTVVLAVTDFQDVDGGRGFDGVECVRARSRGVEE